MNSVGSIPSFGAWWKWVGGIGLFLIVITVAPFYVPEYSQSWRIVGTFSLGIEENFGAWWSGIVLFVAGALFYELHSRAADDLRLPWLLFAVLLTVLSMDEITSVHERLSWSHTILAGLPFGVMYIYAIGRLFSHPHTRRAAWLIFFGFLCFLSIGIQEYLEFRITWPDWAKGIRVGIEEGTELLGSFLVLYGIVVQRGRTGAIGIAAIVPAPAHLRHLTALLLLGLALHFVAVLIIAANLDDLGRRGHPGSWYPAMVFLLIAASAFGKSTEARTGQGSLWGVLTAVFLLCSLSAVYFRLPVYVNIIGLPSYLLDDFYFLYASALAVTLSFFALPAYRTRRNMALLAAMVLVIALEIGFKGTALPQLALGVFAYLCARFFLLERSEA